MGRPVKPKAPAKTDKPGRLRLISGIWRGRLIEAPADMDVRPTAERTRESLFNRLMHAFPNEDFSLKGAKVADLCAGSGALGLEALSRGAAEATFVDQSPTALALIRRNVATLAAEDRATIISGDARALPRAMRTCDLAMLDPPYGQNLITPMLMSLAAQNWLRAGAVVTVETDASEVFDIPSGYTLHDRRETGRAAVTLLRKT